MSDAARTQQGRIQALSVSLTQALAPVADVRRLDVLDTTTRGTLRQTLQGILEEAGAIRRTFNATDMGQETRSGDALQVMHAWIWQRDACNLLLTVEREARAALAGLQEEGARSRKIRVREGQTLQSLAARHLGDYRRWAEIATLNELQPWDELPDVLWIPEDL